MHFCLTAFTSVYLAYYNLEGKPLAKCLLTSCVFLMSTVPPSQRLGTALANAVGQLRFQKVEVGLPWKASLAVWTDHQLDPRNRKTTYT